MLTLLEKDNISIFGDIIQTTTTDGSKTEDKQLRLRFSILVNGKIKNWGTSYNIEKENGEYKLQNYSAWYDTKDLLCSLGYDLDEENINHYIYKFDI